MYYLNTETDEALWERPAGFVEAAVDDSEAAAPAVPGLDLKFAAAAEEGDDGAAPSTARLVGSDAAMPTPRNVCAPPGASPAKPQSVDYSVSKRPRGCAPPSGAPPPGATLRPWEAVTLNRPAEDGATG